MLSFDVSLKKVITLFCAYVLMRILRVYIRGKWVEGKGVGEGSGNKSVCHWPYLYVSLGLPPRFLLLEDAQRL